MCRVDGESICPKCGGLTYWAGNDETGEGSGYRCTKCEFFEAAVINKPSSPPAIKKVIT